MYSMDRDLSMDLDLPIEEGPTMYSMNLDLPSDMRKFFVALQREVKVTGITDDGSSVMVQFEHDGDDYDLAFRARAIAEDASEFVFDDSFGDGEVLNFSRPVKVTAPGVEPMNEAEWTPRWTPPKWEE